MPPTLTSRINIPVRPSDLVKLDIAARRRNISRAEIVREAIRRYLADTKQAS